MENILHFLVPTKILHRRFASAALRVRWEARSEIGEYTPLLCCPLAQQLASISLNPRLQPWESQFARNLLRCSHLRLENTADGRLKLEHTKG
jgi:hypothetical protein